MAQAAVIACVVLALVTLSATVSARDLLHKHGKHHEGGKHHGHHQGHGKCKTISQVLHETPSLKRFAAAFDQAHVPYLEGLVNDPHARATFLAVQDGNLGTGDTVFDEAPIRFQQHTVLEKIKTCKAHSGDKYTTLAGTKLTVVREEAAHSGRHLLQTQLSTAWTALLDSLPANEDVPATTRPVSDAAFALPATLPATQQSLPEGQPEGRPMPHAEHAGDHGMKHDKHEGEHKLKHGKQGGKHMKHEGPHGEDHHHHHHQHYTAADMVAYAMHKTEKKTAKHGALYLQVNDTSQRIEVLGSVHACEATVLIVSAFLNAPPTPDPVVVLQAQQQYHPNPKAYGKLHHHGHHHGWVRHAKHALGAAVDRITRFFGLAGPPRKPCGKHAERHLKHPESHGEAGGLAGVDSRPEALLSQPMDPELLAYWAAKERSAAEQGLKKFYKVQLARHGGAQVQQRLADPRVLTVEQERFPLNLAVEAALALEGSAEQLAEQFHLDGPL